MLYFPGVPCHSESLLQDWLSKPASFLTECVLTASMLVRLYELWWLCFKSLVCLAKREWCQLNLGGTKYWRTQRMVSLFSSKTTAVFVECVMRSLDEIIPTYKGLGISGDRCWHLIVRGLSCYESLAKQNKLWTDHSLDWWICLHIFLPFKNTGVGKLKQDYRRVSHSKLQKPESYMFWLKQPGRKTG